jgi:hypothetical protein
MMVIATTVAIALVASSAVAVGAAAPGSSDAVPPMVVTVSVDAALSPPLVQGVLAQADAIWRPGGISFVWRRLQRAGAPDLGDAAPCLPGTLHLTIGESRGTAKDGHLPLGWILFDEPTAPAPEIYLSYANARQMMEDARGVVGLVDRMPVLQRETLLARAMGRALAHELGHYLLASKFHTERGLMKATLTAAELFMPDSHRLGIEPAQRRAVAARLRGEPLVASRQSGL